MHDFEFDQRTSFEWDNWKNELNQQKHNIDFEDASEIFYGDLVFLQSNRNNEERWIAVGYSENRLIAVVFTRRKNSIRIISARRARKNEERDYHNQKMGRSAEGKN